MQVYLLMAISIYVGALFGFIFGIVDVEDYAKNPFALVIVLVEEISFCMPIGMLFGAFAGFMTEFMRQ
jgi:ABC-type xylose transport system permease subunit